MDLLCVARHCCQRALLSAALIVPAAAACTPGTQSPSVTVCQPKPNSIVSTPAHVVASTTDSHTVIAVQVYVDNKLVKQVNANTLTGN